MFSFCISKLACGEIRVSGCGSFVWRVVSGCGSFIWRIVNLFDVSGGFQVGGKVGL